MNYYVIDLPNAHCVALTSVTHMGGRMMSQLTLALTNRHKEWKSAPTSLSIASLFRSDIQESRIKAESYVQEMSIDLYLHGHICSFLQLQCRNSSTSKHNKALTSFSFLLFAFLVSQSIICLCSNLVNVCCKAQLFLLEQ